MNDRRAPLIAGAAVGVLAILAIMFLVLPKMRSVGVAQDDLAAAEQDAQSLQAQLGSLRQAQEAAPETERQIALVEDQVPPVADLPALFQQLQAAADRSAVDFFSFNPGTPTVDPTNRYSVLAAQISVNGGYFSVDEFLFLLETLPRAAKVTAIAIAPSTSGADTTGGTPTTPAASVSALQLQATVEFYTTDVSAGPGSEPGPSNGTGATGATGVAP